MFYVVQEGLEDPIKFDRYRDAVAKWEELVAKEPNKKAGVFDGGDTALRWHFGDFLTSSKSR